MNAENQFQVTNISIKSSKDWTITTADGRSIVMRKPPNSTVCHLSDLLGPVPDRTFNLYLPLLWVQSIDGEMQHFGNRSGMDALLNKIDDAYGEVVAGMGGAKSNAEEVEAAKK